MRKKSGIGDMSVSERNLYQRKGCIREISIFKICLRESSALERHLHWIDP